jgi:hypothetical protein
MPDEKGKVSEQEKADLSKQRGAAAATIKDPEKRRQFIAAQGDTEGKKKDLPVLDYKNLTQEAADTQAIAQYKKGTDYVPKTGNYKLHEGEAVLTKKENEKRGDGAGKKKKHLHQVITTQARDGSWSHEHVYKDDPEHQHSSPPVFAGTSQNMEDMHSHMDDHWGPQANADAPAGGDDEAAEGAQPAGEEEAEQPAQ